MTTNPSTRAATAKAPTTAVSAPPVPSSAAFVPADPLERVAEKLRSNNIEAIVVDSAAEARDLVIGMVPEGAEVHSGKSKTIEELGLFKELMESGRYDAIRPKLYAMDRKTQGREMRKLGAAPDYELGSVAAITEDGALVVASATGNQTAAYAGGAGRVILVVGSQKLVKDLDAALVRIREIVFPYENEQVRARVGVDTKLNKLLVIYGEWVERRTTVVLVREPVGI
ncbi:MAG TPA: lactate utilization protein [Candidatus Eisenbacteria bacterium]|nr:lactate utilization protein [Candidatus Eisenbacteria bacterium]